jgi:hypothetical protein
MTVEGLRLAEVRQSFDAPALYRASVETLIEEGHSPFLFAAMGTRH